MMILVVPSPGVQEIMPLSTLLVVMATAILCVGHTYTSSERGAAFVISSRGGSVHYNTYIENAAAVIDDTESSENLATVKENHP